MDHRPQYPAATETGAIALETHSLTPVSSGEYKLVTRATLNSLGQADESKDCVDLATTISIHSALAARQSPHTPQ